MIFARELFEKVENIKLLVQFMHRRLCGDREFPVRQMTENTTPDHDKSRPWGKRVPYLWNGDVPGGNFLVDPFPAECPVVLRQQNFRLLELWGADSVPCQPTCGSLSGAGQGAAKNKRQTGGGNQCPVIVIPPGQSPPGGGSGPNHGPGSGPGGDPSVITFLSGPASPTCAAGHWCGTRCTGFFCLPNPTGKPKDQWDPQDPRSPGYAPIPTPSTPPGGGNGNPPGGGTGDPPGGDNGGSPGSGNGDSPGGGNGNTPNATTARPTPPPGPTPQPPSPPKQYFAIVELDDLYRDPSPYGEAGCLRYGLVYHLFYMGEHHKESTTQCNPNWLAGTKIAQSGSLVGTYTNAGLSANVWRVARTSYGGNLHSGAGYHQRCVTDNASMDICRENCGSYWVRKLKCEGVWHADG